MLVRALVISSILSGANLRNKLRTSLSVTLALMLAFVGLIGAAPATATVEWVSAPTWKNLHAKIEDGVFERVRREFDTSSRLLVDSETQHNIAWVRTDRNSVTVQYQGGITNANRKVQFDLSGDVAFSYTGDIQVAAGAVANAIFETDATGLAEVTLTLPGTPVEETDLRVGLTSGEGDTATSIGNLVLEWQSPGFFPIIKLVGSGNGFTSQCAYRVTNNLQQTPRAHECTNGDFQEYTWAWSVFKKDWLPEYSQVYVKSYKYGSTINLTYKVTDIWGTVQVDRDVHLIVDQGCRLCRWYSYDSDKATDANGLVSYSVRNRNTLSEVKNNKFVNSDTKAKEGGLIAFSIQPTTNALDESADYIWPQLVTDVNIKASASALTTVSRGGNAVNGMGDYVTSVDGELVTNPPLSLDTTDTQTTDIDVVNLNITYMKNSLPIAIYSPDIVVTSDNGGMAAIFDTLRPLSGLASSSSFRSTLTFSYTYPQKIALMCTKTGITNFKVATGSSFKTHTMRCKNSLSDARNIEALDPPIAVPGSPAQQKFRVTDRWGNAVAGATVRFTSTGTGSLVTIADLISDSEGMVSAEVGSSESGSQEITATIQDPDSVTQIAMGTSTISKTVVWGAQAVTLIASSKQVTFNFFNLVGSRATILEGKAKTYVNVLTPTQTFVKKYTKGKHTLKVTVGSVVKTVTLTVP